MGPQIILRNVNTLDFRYFDATGVMLGPTPLSAGNIDQVRYIEIEIEGESEQEEPVNYLTRVLVRNE
jgi:hypothetical protein